MRRLGAEVTISADPSYARLIRTVLSTKVGNGMPVEEASGGIGRVERTRTGAGTAEVYLLRQRVSRSLVTVWFVVSSAKVLCTPEGQANGRAITAAYPPRSDRTVLTERLSVAHI